MARIGDRLARLEEALNIDGGLPAHIFGLVPIPAAHGGGDVYSADEILTWLETGATRLAFEGHAILYTGTPNNAEQLTSAEWLAQCAPRGVAV